MSQSSFVIQQIQRFPVKGLSAEQLDAVELQVSEGIPGDRLFGFARYDSGFDPQNPKPLPKNRFVVLMNEAALAGIKTRFRAKDQILELTLPSGETTSFEMAQEGGCRDAGQFLHRALGLKDAEAPIFVSSMPHRFTDVSVVSPQMMNAVSILNLASVRELGDRLGTSIHPDRFRMNLVIDGLPAWSELGSVGSTLKIGEVELRILSRTKRCAATEVNPETAERDLKLPPLILKEYGHMDMGVYAEVVSGGQLTVKQSGLMTS